MGVRGTPCGSCPSSGSASLSSAVAVAGAGTLVSLSRLPSFRVSGVSLHRRERVGECVRARAHVCACHGVWIVCAFCVRVCVCFQRYSYSQPFLALSTCVPVRVRVRARARVCVCARAPCLSAWTSGLLWLPVCERVNFCIGVRVRECACVHASCQSARAFERTGLAPRTHVACWQTGRTCEYPV